MRSLEAVLEEINNVPQVVLEQVEAANPSALLIPPSQVVEFSMGRKPSQSDMRVENNGVSLAIQVRRSDSGIVSTYEYERGEDHTPRQFSLLSKQQFASFIYYGPGFVPFENQFTGTVESTFSFQPELKKIKQELIHYTLLATPGKPLEARCRLVIHLQKNQDGSWHHLLGEALEFSWQDREQILFLSTDHKRSSHIKVSFANDAPVPEETVLNAFNDFMILRLPPLPLALENALSSYPVFRPDKAD